ncbi:hypothetical protein ACFYXH_21295 [Streptomyces sp. NPDC002730]|uniref:hypothetical protein n=1 Tax=Streptomyces sp. NPDC002730 TaxID=3364662 RepID=UPI003678B575
MLVRAVPSPIAAASALTSPSRPDRIEDPVIARMQRVRTALGLVAMAWLLLAYPLREGREDFVLGKLEELLIGCCIVVVAGVVGVSLFIFSARAPLGRMYAGRIGGPLSALGAVPLGAGVVWLTVAALGGDIVSTADVGPHDFTFGLFGHTVGTLISGLVIALLFIAAGLACAAVLVAAVCFTLAAAVTGLNSCFRTGDVHKLLPALLSPLLVWSLFGLQLFDDADVAAPPLVIYAFSLGGPLSVSALSLWEVRRLRTRYGMTLRSVLGR